jgi:hypothetical protein
MNPPKLLQLLSMAAIALAAASPLSAQLPRVTTSAAGSFRGHAFVVSPRTGVVAAGGVEQFSATAIQDGEVQWSATGGFISETGLFMAGSTPGTFTVTARTAAAEVTVPVTIVAGPAAPPMTRYVEIRPGDSIQAAVNGNPEGTAFLIKRGVHRRQSVRPKSGTTFVGETGAVLDGEHATGYAFQAHLTSNVTIRGLRVTRYTPANLTAAVDAVETTGWVIEGNEIDHHSNGMLRAYGLRIGSGGVVRGNTIHHNGWLGINGYNVVDTLIEGNELYANPPAWFDDTIGEAANIKLFDVGRIIIRGNIVHDGPFRGIWIDTARPDMTVEHNRVINHGAQGIWYEVSYRGVIRHNYVENAGYLARHNRDWPSDAGIHITNSPDVSVLENTVVRSLNGIIGHQAANYPHGRYGRNELRNLTVQGNWIVMPSGQTGIVQNVGSSDVFVSWNNRFVANRYHVRGNPSPFRWLGLDLNEGQWHAYGQGTADQIIR